MTAALLIPAVLLLVLIATAWYATNYLFHPPAMLEMEIWPDRFGLSYETASFKTEDGVKISAWLIPAAKKTDRTVMLFHGWGDNKGDLLQHVHFLAQNFNLYMLDFRNHGESDSGMTSLGYLETRDTQAALAYLAQARPEWRRNLGLFGHSMGATLAIWAAARHSDIKAVVVESPFASFNEVVNQYACVNYGLPYFPFGITTLALMRWRIGADPEPASPIYHVGSVSPRPMLFIAGDQDKLMPLEVVKRVHGLAGAPKELYTVAGAGHGFVVEVGGDEYRRRVTDFFAKHL